MTILQSLSGISSYPISKEWIKGLLQAEGIDPSSEYDRAAGNLTAFKKVKIQVLRYLSTAPDISQGGIRYNFDSETRERFLNMANDLAEDVEGEEHDIYGYIGEDL